MEVEPTNVHQQSSVQSPRPHSHSFGRLEPLDSWRRIFIFLGLILGLFLSFMDTTIVATSIYTIALDFNSLSGSLWVVLAYTLAFLSSAVIFAKASDFIGRRSAVLIAFTLFIAFSTACGFSQSITQLIIFRALQGVGGAGLYALSLILLVEAGKLEIKLLTSSLIGATISLAGAVGPDTTLIFIQETMKLTRFQLIGGLLTSHASWRWVFWVNVPVGFVAAISFVIGWPNHTNAYDNDMRLSLSQFDFVGASLLLAASALIVFAVQTAGTGSHSWSSGDVIVALVVGCTCWALLFSWEYLLEKARWSGRIASVFPYTVWTNRVLISGTVVTMLTGFSFFLVVINLPLRLQIVNNKSPSTAGVGILPLLFASGVGSFTSSFFLRKKNLTFQCLVSAAGLVLLGCGLLTTLSDTVAIEPKCYGFQVILALGVGMTMSAANLLTTLNAGPGYLAVAQGIVAQARMLGGSMGVAAANAILKHVARERLRGILSPQDIDALQTSTKLLDSLDATELSSVRAAFSAAFSQSLRICVYIQAAALVAVLCGAQRRPVSLSGERS